MAYIKSTMRVSKGMDVLNELMGMKSADEIILNDSDIIAVGWNYNASIYIHLNNTTERWFRIIQDELEGISEMRRRHPVNPESLSLTQNFDFVYKGFDINLTFSA